MEPNTLRITFGNSVSPAHELQPLEAASDAEQGLAQLLVSMSAACLTLMRAMIHSLRAHNKTRHNNNRPIESKACATYSRTE